MLVRSLAAVLALTSFAAAQQDPPRTPVLVELFTSEGCSSCPPADALLARLDREQPVPNAEIIVLGEHVDYWDQLGWRDRFSSRQFTDRQSVYGLQFHLPDVYTPQMVVAGASEFNGADARAASRAIVQAALQPGLALALTGQKLDGRKLSATVRTNQPTGASLRSDLFAALVSPAETTQVRSGENSGHTLHHAGVVRSLTRIGSLADAAKGLAFTVETPAQEQPMRLVVFAQAPTQGPILGAVSGAIPAPSRNTTATLR